MVVERKCSRHNVALRMAGLPCAKSGRLGHCDVASAPSVHTIYRTEPARLAVCTTTCAGHVRVTALCTAQSRQVPSSGALPTHWRLPWQALCHWPCPPDASERLPPLSCLFLSDPLVGVPLPLGPPPPTLQQGLLTVPHDVELRVHTRLPDPSPARTEQTRGDLCADVCLVRLLCVRERDTVQHMTKDLLQPTLFLASDRLQKHCVDADATHFSGCSESGFLSAARYAVSASSVSASSGTVDPPIQTDSMFTLNRTSSSLFWKLDTAKEPRRSVTSSNFDGGKGANSAAVTNSSGLRGAGPKRPERTRGHRQAVMSVSRLTA